MKTSQRLIKWLFYLVVLPATVGICAWQGWRWWSWAIAPISDTATVSADAEPPTVKIEIPSGTSAQQIGEDLESVGLIRSSDAWDLWFRWQSLRDREGGFLAGTYELSPADPMTAIAEQIWRGEVVQQSFTIPEGWSIRQMAAYFESQGWFTAEEFRQAVDQIPGDRYPWLPEDLPNLEGFLYPDTYQLGHNPTPEDVITLMLDRFNQVALPLYDQSQTPYSLKEWVTLASIVEKEAVVAEERPLIASVFAKRLRENIPLGADPTVEYAFGIQQTVDQPLTLSQVNMPSPYNTYLNPGLPPGPIASPGLASLEASLNPADTEYLFFMARYDGTHIFSRTLEEHEAAKALVDEALSSQTEPSSSAN